MTGLKAPSDVPVYDKITFYNSSLAGDGGEYAVADELWDGPITPCNRVGYNSNGVHDYATAEEVGPSIRSAPSPPLPALPAGTGFDYAKIDVLRKALPPLPSGTRIGHDYAALARNNEVQRPAPPPTMIMGGSNTRPILRRNSSAPECPFQRLPYSSAPAPVHYKVEPWYHANLRREGAEQKLRAAKKNAPDGLFLLRNTNSSPTVLCLSVTYAGNDKVYHNRIEILADGRFKYLGTGDKCAPFVSCRHLINHHHALHPRVADQISPKLAANQNSKGSIRLRAYVPS